MLPAGQEQKNEKEDARPNTRKTPPCSCDPSSCDGVCRPESLAKPVTVAIIGRPNSGKSHIFTNLTQKYSQSGNYPNTTLKEKRGMFELSGRQYEVIDTPGLQGLFVNSEEELQVRNLLLTQKPDCIVQCADASRLKQSLALTADLMELNIPLILCLNAIDETARQGTWIDSRLLSKTLGIPVLEMVAVRGAGTTELKKTINRACQGKFDLHYGNLIEDAIASICEEFPPDLDFKRKRAILLLRNDPYLHRRMEDQLGKKIMDKVAENVKTARNHYKGNISWQIINRRALWVDELTEKIVKKQKLPLIGKSEKFAKWSRNPVTGAPIMISILLVIFFAVVNVANRLAAFANTWLWLPLENAVNHMLGPGMINEFLIGHYGILTLGVSNAILTVLPILGIFFFLFNMLEDSGYIPNLCVLLRKVSARVGVTGNAILPVTLAFGCKTMATLATRSLRSKKEKFIAVYLIAFGIPCAAQMGLNMSILGGLGLKALAITFSVLGVVWVSVGMTLNKILKNDLKDDFILELPPMRIPPLKPVLRKTFHKLQDFLKEAMPIFISAAVILFIADKTGMLTALKKLLKPVITGFLGFPLEMVDVLVLLMAKHEAAAGMLIKLVNNGRLNYIQTIVAVALTMMFIPCLTNIVAIFKEQGPKKATVMVLSINLTAIIVAGSLNSILLRIL
ncbi:Magnetosome protein involved in iron transport into the magnetosomes Mad17-2 [Candidatus Desulfarcum epimagneticum]|uniref:Ferrous iron transport protein B n=1 Tax=uncultured Desulfobacteraceae bacterium TaxID=218296 RepID=A0A484HH25_9BACT|nr:Magnetosome protein involved in iron transport into the magnetosomes Mad17-2 [uncultured Desulfobacteraceae bacterium]